MSNLTRSLRVLVYTWLTLIGFSLAFAVEAPVRIMPLGDSITLGQAEPGAEGGYRDRLHTLLTSAGFNVDFVGTYSDTFNPGLPDTNHQGAPGYRVDEVNASIGGWLDALDDPDVILIQIGTNDFLQVDRNETPAGVLAELDTLITSIATQRPFAKIVVSTLILTTYSASVEAKQVTYNQGIPGLVAQHVALGRQVSMVDLHPVLNSGDLYDTVHPTTAGYDKMADAWLPGITSVIAPKGTSNAPLIAKVKTPNDLTKLAVTFSKPVADSSTTLNNYSISGGLTVSAASLDSAKRTVTLTTSAQTPGEIYTLTVSGVRDRTTQQTIIAPLSKAMFYPNLLNNGSFESFYTGWSTHAGNQEIKTESLFSPYTTPDGEKLLAFNTGDQSPNGVLIQSFPTVAGQNYRLTYNLGIISWQFNSTQSLSVNVQGSNTRLAATSTVVGYGGSGTSPAVFWYPWSYEFTANTSTTTLIFADSSGTDQSYSKDMLLDNVKIVRAEIGAYLAVTSTPNAGAIISPINPTDTGGNGSGTASLIRSYATGTAVTLTAPSTASGRNFQKWQLNGADIPGTGPFNRTINLTLRSNTTVNAFYDSSGTILPVAVADGYTTDGDTQLIVAAPGVLLNDSDANALPLTAALVTGPTKGSLTLNPNGGFTYTPNTNSTGADSFTYRVNNGSLNSGNATVSITLIPVNNPPVAVNDGSTGSPYLTVAEDSGQSASMTVLTNDSDPNGDTLTITNATSPNGTVSIVNSNMNLKFTPAANYNGATTIYYTISDGNGGTANATVYINVTSVNDLPVAVNDGSAGSPFLTVAEDSGQTVSMTVLSNDSDPDGNALTIIDASSPNGSVNTSFFDTRLRFTPVANFNGPTTIPHTISDGNGGTASATVFITVTPVNDAPVAIAQNLTTNEDTALGISLAGSDIDGDILSSFAVTAQPLHGTLTGTGANRTYTPNANYHGPDSFSFKVSDASLQSPAATVSIDVRSINDAPIANSQSASTNEDTALAITLAGSDIDGDTLTTFNVIAQPQNGTLTGTGANRTYTPNANYNGPDSFTFKVSDASLQSVAAASVSITVSPVNDLPVAVNDGSVGLPFLTVAEDSGPSANLSVLANDTDVDGHSLTITAASSPNGSVNIVNSNTQLQLSPATNFLGDTTISYTISDGNGGTATATGYVNVTPVNDAPVATAQSASTFEDNPLPITLAGTDIDGDTLSVFNVIIPPQHGTFTGTGADRTYTPDANYNGPDSFTFKVSDASLQSVAAATVSITVNPVNDAPLATAQAVSVNEDGSVAITLTGIDVENSALTFAKVNPSNGTLTGTAPNLTYTPVANYSGSDSFTFTVSDGSNVSTPATVSISVTPVNDPPVAVNDGSVGLPFLTVAEDSGPSANLSVLANDTDVDGHSLTITAASSPNGTVVINGDGTLAFTPAADFFGPTTIQQTISDGNGGTANATAHVLVTAVNDAPVSTADSYATSEDTPLTILSSGVLNNDSDQETSTLSATLILSVTHGTLNLESDGCFTYTPETHFNGEDSFTYRASDGDLTSNVVTVTVTVNPVNDIPVALPDSISVDEDEQVDTTLTATDVEGTPLTFAVATQPANGNVTLSGAVATYTPNPDFHGADSFTFASSDGVATSAPATVSIVVNPVDEFRQWLEGKSLIGGPNDDPDGDSISNALEFVLGGDPATASDGGILPTAVPTTADMDTNPGDEEYLLFAYRKSGRSEVDPSTTAKVEWATNLAGPWNTADGTHGEKFETIPGGSDATIKVYIPRSVEGDGMLFTRLKVVLDLPTSPPPPDE